MPSTHRTRTDCDNDVLYFLFKNISSRRFIIPAKARGSADNDVKKKESASQSFGKDSCESRYKYFPV